MTAASSLTFPFPYPVYPHLDGLNIGPHGKTPRSCAAPKPSSYTWRGRHQRSSPLTWCIWGDPSLWLDQRPLTALPIHHEDHLEALPAVLGPAPIYGPDGRPRKPNPRSVT